MTRPTTKKTPVRTTYRHGDLRRALLDAGIQLARDGGPDAVVLREATRQAGVVPNAAYRHFASRQELLQAVRAAALSALAVAMETELAKLSRGRRPADFARASLQAVGTGYLRFAQAEPGLFHTAFSVPDEVEDDVDPAKAGHSGLNPFQLLSAALDRLVEAGALPSERRPGAEYLAWSAVHGLALLVIDGPLRSATRAQLDAIGQRLLDMVEKGL
ncbi:MAG TPA: TetR/AcrR family transcriptional regulator [Burkholderiaceae bacterium]|jgi:AcrR family transcriptional regulator|nr:TetR/AcrR family transcriptional regulator [Burkholderiaceae bacterium]